MLTDSRINNIIKRELVFHTVHAGGKGGQNVNKVETKVMIAFNIAQSSILKEEEKLIILARYKNITKDLNIHLVCDTHRTQLQNKKEALLKFRQLLKKLFVIPKKRIPTRPSKSSKVKRKEGKIIKGEIKKLRKKIL